MVEAIFYVLRTAVAWRDLPTCYGPWNSVYTRWRRWCALGLWQEILSLLSRRATGCLRFIDGSHIKLHQFGCNPAGGQKAQAIGRTKGGLNTKLCALVEGQGRLLCLMPSRMSWWSATRALMPMPCAKSCWRKAAWRPFRRDRDVVLRLGITGVFIGNGTKLKTSSSGSKSTSVSPPAMKNSPSLFLILSS